MLNRGLAAIAAVLLLLAAVPLFRTARATSRQIQPDRSALVNVDSSRAAQHLAEAIRFRTVSHDSEPLNAVEFAGLQEWIGKTYPRVQSKLRREVINGRSLLYLWPGSEPSLILMAHMDVVPAAEAGWAHPPFEGRTAGGFVWGRGALDDKLSLVAILDAVEGLLATGFVPRTAVYLAFGHDEELMGTDGARTIAGLLRSRGVRPSLVLDEGGAITAGMVPGLQVPAASVGVAEKGYADLELTVESPGGHSSAPPRNTAVGILSRAIHRIEDNPAPAAVTGVLRQTAAYLGPEMPFAQRLAMTNLSLLGPFVKKAMESSPSGNAQIRTTAAATVFEGSPKSNVLPQRARAVVNLRILPGDSIASASERIRRAVGDARVHMRIIGGTEPSPISHLESGEGRLLETTLRQIYPEAVVGPVLMLGASDSRHFAALTPNIFRFAPFTATEETLLIMHGVNERVSLIDCRNAVRFYAQFIVNVTSGRWPPRSAASTQARRWTSARDRAHATLLPSERYLPVP